MNYEEFQHLARLFIVGSLDEEEMERFCTGRMQFGSRAEDFIVECKNLNTLFALSLRPMPPSPAVKRRLLDQIKNGLPPSDSEDFGNSRELSTAFGEFTMNCRLPGRN